jgi:molybdenum cofactor synthesis domain-containing protein
MAEPGYPDYNASIMDGYAIRSSDMFTSSETEWTHTVLDKVFAGDDDYPYQTFAEGTPVAYYITTGAVVPDDCDCVVPVEECTVSESGRQIAIHASAVVEPDTWIRKVGCDMPAGSVVLQKGHILDPVSLGLILQSRTRQIQVLKPINVGVLSTGNELLQSAEAEPQPGKIPDVNRPILLALLSTYGTCVPIDLGIQRDDNLDSLTESLRSGLQQCDAIITTGGISMGETDVLEQVLVDRLGGVLHFGRMHMKPGKPTTLISYREGKLVFAMPGNPVSATVCTQLLVRPCLDLLFHGADETADTHGESTEEFLYRIVQNAFVHPEVMAKLGHDMKLDMERPEYHRVVLKRDGKDVVAHSTGVQRSSRLASLRDAEGLLVLPQGVGRSKVAAGDEFTVLLLHGQARDRVQVCNSLHLNSKINRSFSIAVLLVQDPTSRQEDIDVLGSAAKRVQEALSGSKSGSADIVSARSFSGSVGDVFDLATSICEAGSVDVLVLVCQSFIGSFLYHLDLAHILRKKLVKVADAMAVQARSGAASDESSNAIFETVVGFCPRGRGCMMISLPESGVNSGLSNVRGLLKHALQVARGQRDHN